MNLNKIIRFKMKHVLVLFFVLISTFSFAQNFESIESYQVHYALATNNKEKCIAFRSFKSNNQHFLLLVDPETMQTKVELANAYSISSLAIEDVLSNFKNTAYVNALTLALQREGSLQNAGIDRPLPGEKGINLTVDLCPSHKGLDRIIFQDIFNEFKQIEQPAPIAISVSGKWMLKHQDDLNWLKSLVEKKELNITWINHSYNHEVNNLPLVENFLLSSGTNLDVEVLENEKLMLMNKLIPSVFFRFPGLVSDESLVLKIEKYGLIPIGSDAWLAKGGKVNAGSIVLIHGNGNEELGVKDFIALLKSNQAEVTKKQWLLYDLKQGLENAEKKSP